MSDTRLAAALQPQVSYSTRIAAIEAAPQHKKNKIYSRRDWDALLAVEQELKADPALRNTRRRRDLIGQVTKVADKIYPQLLINSERSRKAAQTRREMWGLTHRRHRSNPIPPRRVNFQEDSLTTHTHALNGYLSTHVIVPPESLAMSATASEVLAQAREMISAAIRSKFTAIRVGEAMRFRVVIVAHYSKHNENAVYAHSSKTVSLTAIGDLNTRLDEAFNQVQVKFDEFEARGSGWDLDSIERIEVEMARYKHRRGSGYVKLPDWVNAKKAVLNVKNNDDKCFLWSILAHLHPVTKNAERVTKYMPYEQELNITGIKFPVEVKQIDKFEEQNPTLAINVHGLLPGASECFPMRISKRFDPTRQGQTIRDVDEGNEINLLLYNSHYSLIKSMTKLINKLHFHNAAICPRCHSGFTSKAKMLEHRSNGCGNHKACVASLPPKEAATISFQQHIRQQRLPYVIYADTEAILPKSDEVHNGQGDIISNDLDLGTRSKYTNKHIMCSYYYVIVSNGQIVRESFFRGANANQKFAKSLKQDGDWIIEQYQKNTPMVMTEEDTRQHKRCTQCYLCKGQFKTGDENTALGSGNQTQVRPYWKVRDHDHMTGQYRGALHSKCNINYNNRYTKIPVIFHNGSNYDTHLFLTDIAKQFKKIDIIPKTMEKYMTITADHFQFIDSFAHLTSSLDKLVENLKRSGNLAANFKLLHSRFNEEQAAAMTRKGVYPYEYMDSFAKFDETCLPPIESFFSQLEDKTISQSNYDYGKGIFTKYCQTLGDYHDLYLKTDVLLLADVFESYRNLSMQYYELDPCWYITLPSQSWNNLLKMTKAKIECFNDQQYDMLLMTENGIRGGVSCIVNRFAETDQETSIKYFDANNLYGWAMSQYLPTGDYQWEQPDTFTSEYISSIADDADRGYILEVDMTIPAELHDTLRDYPPAPEKCLITDDMLSPFTAKMKEKLDIKKDVTEKLILSLRDKQKYVVHYRTLKFYCELGVVVKKVHRVISFKQSPWMEPYIRFNSEKRQQATTDFEKDFFKLLNNSVFGKTIENVRKRTNVKLYTSELPPNLTRMANYQKHQIFNQDLAAIEFSKQKIKFDKPIIIGMSILDLSKLHMYKAYYGFKQRYPSMRLLMTDTDSLVLRVPKQFEHDMVNDPVFNAEFDLSNYKQDHPAHSVVNKAIIGKFKDEMGGAPINAFVGLRSKMYSLLTGDKEVVHAKGIKRAAMQKLKFNSYKDILFKQSQEQCEFHIIKSSKHCLYTQIVRKTGLSCYDNKFHQLNNFESVPYGYRGQIIALGSGNQTQVIAQP